MLSRHRQLRDLALRQSVQFWSTGSSVGCLCDPILSHARCYLTIFKSTKTSKAWDSMILHDLHTRDSKKMEKCLTSLALKVTHNLIEETTCSIMFLVYTTTTSYRSRVLSIYIPLTHLLNHHQSGGQKMDNSKQ